MKVRDPTTGRRKFSAAAPKRTHGRLLSIETISNWFKNTYNKLKQNKKVILNPIQAYANAMTVSELRAKLNYHKKSKKIKKEQLVKEMTHMVMNQKNAIYQK